MKRCLASLIIRENANQTTMRCHLTLDRMAIIKKSTTQVLESVWRKGHPPSLLLGMSIDTAPMETVWRFLKKLGIKPAYDPAIPLLGIYPEETKTEKDTCTQRSLQHYLQ